jgi:hypothetical protein
MAASGMAMMLKSLGLDPDELKGNVEAFMSHMKDQAEKINQNQARLESKLDALENSLGNIAHILAALSLLVAPQASTTAILENGAHSGNLITSEKFPTEMIEDVMTAGIPTASDFEAAIPGGDYGRRVRSNNEE